MTRRRAIQWPSVVLVVALLAAGATFYGLGEHVIGTGLATFAVGLVTPLRLGARAEGGGDSEQP